MAPSSSALARMNELHNGSCLISSVLVPHSHHPIIKTYLFERFGAPTVPKLAFEEFFLPFFRIFATREQTLERCSNLTLASAFFAAGTKGPFSPGS